MFVVVRSVLVDSSISCLMPFRRLIVDCRPSRSRSQIGSTDLGEYSSPWNDLDSRLADMVSVM